MKKKEIDEILKNEILQIGTLIATIWGASCYDFEVFPRKKIVTFHCVEHKEKFTTDISFEDIKKNYNYDIEMKYKGIKAKKVEKNNANKLNKELYDNLSEIGRIPPPLNEV